MLFKSFELKVYLAQVYESWTEHTRYLLQIIPRFIQDFITANGTCNFFIKIIRPNAADLKVRFYLWTFLISNLIKNGNSKLSLVQQIVLFFYRHWTRCQIVPKRIWTEDVSQSTRNGRTSFLKLRKCRM